MKTNSARRRAKDFANGASNYMSGMSRRKRQLAIRDNVESNSSDQGASGGRPRPWLTAACCLTVLVCVVLAYGRTLGQDFVDWDDPVHVLRNPYLDPPTAVHLQYFWTHSYEKLYIPLSYMVFAGLTMLARPGDRQQSFSHEDTLLDPHVFHAANLGLHAVNALLVFFLLRRLLGLPGLSHFDRERPLEPFALAGTLLFALHPVQVESVAWISELRGLLSALFTLASILLFLRADQSFRSASYWVSILFGACALLSKPSAVVLPLFLIVLDRWCVGRSWRTCLLAVLPWVVIDIPFVLLTRSIQQVSAAMTAPWWGRFFIAGDSLEFYLGKLLAPVSLNIDYGRKPATVLANRSAYVEWLVPAAVAFLVSLAARRPHHARPWVAAGALLSLAAVLPVLGLTPFAYQEHSTVADRYLYLAMLGPAFLLAAGLFHVPARWLAVALGTTAAGLAALWFLTATQVKHWDNSLSLYSYAVTENPNSAGLRINYGVTLDQAGHPSEAIQQWGMAIKIDPAYPRLSIVYVDIGIALTQEGDRADGMTAFQKAVAAEPGYALAHQDLGQAYLEEGDLTHAVDEFQTALRLEPTNKRAAAGLSKALAEETSSGQ